MKFATILDGDRHRFGLVDGDALHLAPAGETLRDHLAGDLAALAQRLRGLPATPLEGVTWAPVVPDPAKESRTRASSFGCCETKNSISSGGFGKSNSRFPIMRS